MGGTRNSLDSAASGVGIREPRQRSTKPSGYPEHLSTLRHDRSPQPPVSPTGSMSNLKKTCSILHKKRLQCYRYFLFLYFSDQVSEIQIRIKLLLYL